MDLLIGMMIGGMAYAGIESINVQSRLSSIIVQIRDLSFSSSQRLNALKQTGSDLVTSNPSDFEAGDKTKLTEFSALVTTAKNALDAVHSYDWGNIE